MPRVYATGSDDKDNRLDYTDKSEPISEHECIWCMACVTVCPTKAIKIEHSKREFRQRASETFSEVAAQ